MAYLGNDLQVAYQSYQIIDDISGSFNGVLTTFPLQVGGVTPVPFPINPQQCLISVNGVIQEPDPSGTSGFNLVGSNIEFSSAPTGGHAFFGVILAGADYVNVGVNYPSGSESAPSITFDADLDTGIFNPADNELGFSTNSVQRLKIESDGDINIDSGGVFYDATNNRLAIGTTTVNTTLEVLNSSAPIIRVGDGIRHVELRGGSTGQNAGVGTNYPGTFDIIQNGSAAVTIDTSKRVLVGTSSSSDNATIVAEGSSGGAGNPAILYFRRNEATPGTGGNLGQIHFSDNTGGSGIGATINAARDGGTWSGASKPTRLMFSTTADGASSPTERMRITRNGRIDTFSSIAGIVSATSAAAGTTVSTFVGAYGSTGVQIGTNSFVVYSNGNVQNTNNSYGALSDIKLKENIVDASSQWEDLKALQIRNYNLKEGQTHRQIGLIAQEAELVSPGLVYETPDQDREGNDLGTVTKSVNYSVLYMKAVKALQEAMERIETLEAKVAALESA